MARPTDIYERVTGRQLYLVAEFDDSPLNHGKRITDAHMRHERGGNFLLYRFDSIAYKLYKLKALIGPEQSGLFHWCVVLVGFGFNFARIVRMRGKRYWRGVFVGGRGSTV